MSREHDAKPIASSFQIKDKDGTVRQSRAELGYNKRAQSNKRVENWKGDHQLRKEQDIKHDFHSQRNGHLAAISTGLHNKASDPHEINALFREHDGKKLIVMKPSVLEEVINETTFHFTNHHGKPTKSKRRDIEGCSNLATAKQTVWLLGIRHPKGQSVYAGIWVKPVLDHDWLYFFHEKFHADGDASSIRCPSNTTNSLSVTYQELIDAALV